MKASGRMRVQLPDEGEGLRGTSSSGSGGRTHDARMAFPGFLLSSLRLSRAPLASGRRMEGDNLHVLSALPSLPLFITSKDYGTQI